MDIIVVKLLSGLLFFVVALCFGWLPFCVYRKLYSSRRGGHTKAGHATKAEDLITHSLHSFASGVLIATCLLHLLPESLEAVEKGLRSGGDKPTGQDTLPNVFRPYNATMAVDKPLEEEEEGKSEESEFYPLAECLVAIGFMFVYMFDSTAKTMQSRKNVTYKFRKPEIDGFESDSSSETDLENEMDHFAQTDETKELVKRSSLKKPTQDSSHAQSRDTFGFCAGCQECYHQCGSNLRELQARELQGRETATSNSIANAKRLSTPRAHVGHAATDVQSAALVMALCVHGFFDGVMLGLQTSNSVMLSLVFALSLHKAFVALSLSLTLAKNYPESVHSDDSQTRRAKSRYLVYILSFAFVAPLGLVTSAAFVHSRLVSSGDNEDSLIPGCLQAFAVGTFMYVTFTETTNRHGKTMTLWTEIRGHVSLLAGFSLMAGLRAAVGST